MQLPKKILCPTDFSDNSLSGLRYALELARTLGAGVDVLHVYHLPMHRVYTRAPTKIEEIPPEASEAIARDFRDLLAELGAAADGIELETHVEVGVPYEKIAEYAETSDAGMVVMATLGRSGITRLLLGSVAERVLRLCHRPVLTVPT
jgi:universal stress protein A